MRAKNPSRRLLALLMAGVAVDFSSARAADMTNAAAWIPDRGDGTSQNAVRVGDDFYLVDRWFGAKVGVIASASSHAAKTGHADFDWVHVTPKIP